MSLYDLARPDWRVDGADWPHREHSRFVQRGGMRWHVQLMGSGPPLLLLHGTGASGHSFQDLMPLLATRFRVVVPDLPGHAFSSPPPFAPSLPALAGALAELLAELALSPVGAVGHSAGAALMTRLTLDGAIRPRFLVGLGAALLPFEGAAALWLPLAAQLLSRSRLAARLIAARARDRANVDRMIRSTGSRLPARGVELYQRLGRCPGHVASVMEMLACWDLVPLAASLPELDVRFLFIAGAADLAIPLSQQREAASRIPGAELAVLASAGHLVHEEQPAAVARHLSDFEARIAASGGSSR